MTTVLCLDILLTSGYSTMVDRGGQSKAWIRLSSHLLLGFNPRNVENMYTLSTSRFKSTIGEGSYVETQGDLIPRPTKLYIPLIWTWPLYCAWITCFFMLVFPPLLPLFSQATKVFLEMSLEVWYVFQLPCHHSAVHPDVSFGWNQKEQQAKREPGDI